MTTIKAAFQPSMLFPGQGFQSSTANVMSPPFNLLFETTQIHPPSVFSRSSSWSQKGVHVDIIFIRNTSHLQTTLSSFIGISSQQVLVHSPFRNIFKFEIVDNALHILVTISVKRATRTLDTAPTVRDPLLPPAISHQDFFDRFGDAYISQIEAGGILVGLIQVLPNEGETVQDLKDIAQEVVNPNFNSDESQASDSSTVADSTINPDPDTRTAQDVFEQTINKMISSRISSVESYYVGGKVRESIMDAPAFVQWAIEFPLLFHIEKQEGLSEEEQMNELLVKGVIVPTYAYATSYNELPQFLDSPLPFSRTSESVVADLQRRYATVRELKAEMTNVLNEKQNMTLLSKEEFQEVNTARNELRDRELKLVESIWNFSRVDDEGRDKILEEVYALADPESIVLRAREIVEQAG